MRWVCSKYLPHRYLKPTSYLLLLLQYFSCNSSTCLCIGKRLFVPLIDKIDYYFHHHILLLRLALGNHQRQSHKGVIGQTFRTICTVKDAVVVEEPKEQRGCNAFVGFAFLLRTSAIQSSLIALGLSSVAVTQRVVLGHQIQQHGCFLLHTGIKFFATEGLIDLPDAALE